METKDLISTELLPEMITNDLDEPKIKLNGELAEKDMKNLHK